ncbi:MAG TPA: hypothetical protein VI299_20065 [Polyangiales bacterium]
MDSAEERFSLALREFSKLALAPRRVPPHGPQLDSRQLELIALAHRALWFGVELRLGDRERTARGFAAAEMLHGELRAALRREISYAREQHMLTLAQDIELGPEPLERSELRIAEVAQSWRESAYELGLPTFARWLGEANVLRELVELYGDLLRVVRVTTLPLRAEGPDPAYLRSLLTLARTGESGAAPRGSIARDLSPEQRETFRQDATRTAKLSALIAREHDAPRPQPSERVLAIARASDSVPPESKLSTLSIDRAPPPGAELEQGATPRGSLPVEELRSMRAETIPVPAPDAVQQPSVAATPEPTPAEPAHESLPVTAMFGAQRAANSILRIALALATLGLLAVLAMALLPVSFWFGPRPAPQSQR